ncbi:cell wall-binding repeat-containing protein [Herbiconiux sp. CPCC 203407]|uniref:Cell wall-binding repeat-containing protein n=1 Tax=Herbiconiux oxytropis TaxID=2970915 RepID=A0AA41XF94_9MICO|nr:cell wall-binding repeat-containing protein [Herbiconiux oxytropis]MCS5722686.1 cell wall-binding repeat-containing protein [Herbiconiux oxytropis]MCS5725383.1 cell wall-binding repeat-containing protein [Herbiconiux oxytropis]
MRRKSNGLPPGRLARAVAAAGSIALTAGAVLVPSAAQAAEPIATDDSYLISADTFFSTAVGAGLLANDLGIDLSALAVVQTGPAHGALSPIGAGGSFTYQPDAGFVGVDVFTYCLKLLPGTPCLGASATVTLQVDGVIERIGGADRYAVSAAVSAQKFPTGVDVAYVASGAVFPDALSASAAAGDGGGPVLLVTKDSVPGAVAAELERLDPKRIVVTGGTDTVSAVVQTALAAYSPVVARIGGADRYAVSAAISAGAFDPKRPVVYVASGGVFPDALSGSAAAGAKGGPVLLVRKDAIPGEVKSELDRLDPATIVVLGGTSTVAQSVEAELRSMAPTTRIEGADRYAVSASITATYFGSPDTRTVYVASGQVFPDALSGSAAAIRNGAPVLLVQKDGVPSLVALELDRLKPSRVVVLGGPDTVSEATYRELAERSRG